MSPLQAALPREMYVDPAAWLRERDRVLFGEWFCVGRTDDLGLRPPGRVAVVDVVGESVLVTRDEHGGLHAAYNVCRHRGSQLFPAEPGAETTGCEAGALRCPYHSWTYSLAGELLRSPHTDDVDPAEFSLHPVGVEEWAGFVFVHLTPGSADPIGEVLARAADQPGRLRHGRAGHGAGADLRGRGQLQGDRGELQRVLPLRPGPPRADAAGARPSVAAGPAWTGPTASRTARAPGRSR